MEKEQQPIAFTPNQNIDSKIITPDNIIDNNDPGDDVLRRFRYQITYSGILSLLMIEKENFEELFCEHHEDILVKFTDQTYAGIQIKTKHLNLPPFNIKDEAIFKSIKRFIILEVAFPEMFKSFSIVSNHGFDQSKKNLCINTLIENIRNGVDVLKPRTKTLSLVRKLCSECNVEDATVLKVICKIRLTSFCSLDDIHMKLINTLKNCNLLKGSTQSQLVQIGDSIIAKFLHASSLSISEESVFLSYMAGNAQITDVLNQCIKDKCIKKHDFIAWLEKEKTLPVTLQLKDRMKAPESQEDHGILEIKMDAGNIDSENISTIKDFKYAFEQHTISWLYKNPENADSKYTQVLAVTKNICKEIYDEKEISQNNSKGQEMLIAVRKEIKERKANDSSIFLDCSYEHILGAVGVLTETCKVWWTPKFEIKK